MSIAEEQDTMQEHRVPGEEHLESFTSQKRVDEDRELLRTGKNKVADQDVNARDNDGRTTLHIAALSGREEVLRELITKYKCPVDCVDSKGNTPLHYAAGKDHAGVVRMLLSELGADAAACNEDGDTVLSMAAFHGHAGVVGILVSEFGCSPSVKGFSGRTPLHHACEGGHLVVVEKLVSEYGCDVNARDNDGLTPLHVAALAGKKEVVRELITKYKCPVDCVDSDGYTPLHKAAKQGHAGVMRMLLLEFGADRAACNECGNTVLDLAALSGHAEVVGVLVSEFGCSPSVKGFSGQTPLHHACFGGHLVVVEKLVSEYGCDVNARDDSGWTPLHVAVALNGEEEVVRELITKYKCPVDCVDSCGYTPLLSAAGEGHAGVVRMLVSEFGADAAARNKDGDTALTLAAFDGHAEVVGVLVSEFGCSPSVKGFSGRTPLHQACEGGHLVVVEKLVSEYGCDVNARDNDGRTPLHVAALAGKEEVVRMLVTEYKCSVDFTNFQLRTPLHLACLAGHTNTARVLLLELKANPSLRDIGNYTPFDLAIKYKHDAIKALITEKFGATLNVGESIGELPLHRACETGHWDTVEELVLEKDYDPMWRDTFGNTPLHVAAQAGQISIIENLIATFKPDRVFFSQNDHGDTPLHLAVAGNHKSVVNSMITNFDCDPDVRGFRGRTPLHVAAGCGYEELVSILISSFNCDPVCLDDDGNTPLHIAALCDRADIAKTLIEKHGCFPSIRNYHSKTALDLSQERRNLACVTELSRYSSTESRHLHKVVLLGCEGSGKSTLIHTLKHACGCTHTPWNDVCQVVQMQVGGQACEVAFIEVPYHPLTEATCVERLTATSSCTVLITIDLRGDPTQQLASWMNLLSCSNSGDPLKVFIVGSFADVLSSQYKDPNKLLQEVYNNVCKLYPRHTSNVEVVECFALDCGCWPNTEEVQNLNDQLQATISSVTDDSAVSANAILLLKLLEREFQDRTLCHLDEIIDHMKNKRYVCSEEEIFQISAYLNELESQGLILLTGTESESPTNRWIVLNTSSLLATASNKLSASTADEEVVRFSSPQAVGMISEAELQTVFPNISLAPIKDCLKQLQVCLEIDNVRPILSLEHVETRDQPGIQGLLFLPFLISSEKQVATWQHQHESPIFTQGFHYKLPGKYDQFSFRFLQMLHLQLASTFVSESAHDSPPSPCHSYRVWKNGVHISLTNGVEVVVEFVGERKEVIVMARSGVDCEVECTTVLATTLQMLLRAKQEYCNRLNAELFLLDSDDISQPTVPEISSIRCYSMNDVEMALDNACKEAILSTDGSKTLPIRRITQMKQYCLWSKLIRLHN